MQKSAMRLFFAVKAKFTKKQRLFWKIMELLKFI